MIVFIFFISFNFILFRYFSFNKQPVSKLLLILILILIVFIFFTKTIDFYGNVFDALFIPNLALSLIFRHVIILFNAKMFYNMKKKGLKYFFSRDISKGLFIFITLIQFLTYVF